MLSNAYFLGKFRFDTAENEPSKKLQNNLLIFPILLTVLSKHRREYADDAPPEFVREATRAGVAARLLERSAVFPSAAVQAVRWSATPATKEQDSIDGSKKRKETGRWRRCIDY